ncbi:YoaK family protein [Nocardioides conyzicola]|uniref:YoaK family protein n=1 Tax=Nocardioides conyzicola TaxID=1651781 RepID=A0ABP8X053_9ACTN
MTADAPGSADLVVRRPGRSLAGSDWLLAGLSFSAGAYEAIAFLTFGKVFTAFQTGNLVFLGLGAAGTRPPAGPEPQTVLVSLVGFVVGCVVAVPLLRGAAPAGRRWPTRVVTTLALGLAVQVVFVLTWTTTSQPDERIGVLVALGALSMGLQMSAVRALDVAGVSTTAFTATLALLAGRAGGQRQPAGMPLRLALVLVAVVLGALVGAEVIDDAHGVAPLAPFAVELVVLVGAARRVTAGADGHR